MRAATYARRVRITVLGCCLFALVVSHVLLRYLFSTLFGYVTYSGLAPVVPFIVIGGYSLLLGVGAVVATLRRGKAGGVLATGFLLLAVEPYTSSFYWGDGCEVGSRGALSLVPDVTVDGIAVVLFAWNGACATSLNTVHIGLGLLLVAVGLWLARVPDTLLSRWLTLIEIDGPSNRPK